MGVPAFSVGTAQFVLGVVMGVLLGWLYERTRSLIPCIALHGAYNTGTVVFGTLANGNGAESWRDAEPALWTGSLVLALIGALALHAMLARPKGTTEVVVE
ncbi:CPBP family intramembrane metalloprotease [Variovorax paradoxus]|nr:CPBP family intramembrane metalloprotease [Variovorax paradoxus]